MTITEKGQEVLRTSGFIDAISDPHCREQLLRHVDEENPKTKLDVENHAKLAISLALLKDTMRPVKAYLYDNPAMRDTFPALAGVYLRDEYLSEHPEITT